MAASGWHRATASAATCRRFGTNRFPASSGESDGRSLRAGLRRRNAPNRVRQRVDVDWLREMPREARVEGPEVVPILRKGRDRDDRHVPSLPERAEPSHESEAIEPGHEEVAQDHV